MKAMILAAGLGTRLRPLTDHLPKALVEINGRTLLEITLARLREVGVQEVIINVHHFPELIAGYLRRHHNFGMAIELSYEPTLLDTGGGLKQAAEFFLRDAAGSEPFILHNVDVVSTIDLARMVEWHKASQALATLAVKSRPTSRYLYFNQQNELCGRQSGSNPTPELVRPSAHPLPLAFSGIHVISPRLLTLLEEAGAFSIISAYLRLAARGERIVAFRADEYFWRDLGRPEDVARTAAEWPPTGGPPTAPSA